jgi:predicted transposase/invertase (TIGR01784 family)
MNMLLTEWNWDDALAVRYEEGLETGMEKGLERGLEKGLERGREEGLEKGREEGRLEGREETARYALMKGMSPEDVSEITGLDLETVNKIARQ